MKENQHNSMKHLILALRPQQWIKNLFIYMPLIFGKQLLVLPMFLKVTFAVVLFSMMSSVVYMINDMLDFDEDKHHPSKLKRPIPSGKVNIEHVKLLILILGALSLIFSFRLNAHLGFVILAYFFLNLIYSGLLKKIVIIDVFCIGIFFLLRIVAGTVITGVKYSHWMIFMIMLLALFLGFNKRRQEIELYGNEARRSVLAKYSSYFIDQMIPVITSSIVVVYMLYTVDERTVNLFGTNHLTYSIPFVYYGIFRYLYLVHKKNAIEDPTHILLRDFGMQLNLFLWLIVCIGVIYFKF